MTGKATLTALPSKAAMNVPNPTTAKVHHLWATTGAAPCCLSKSNLTIRR